MSNRPAASPVASAPGEESTGGNDYALMAVMGLLFMTVVLVQEGVTWWVLLPAAVGVVGLVLPGAVSPTLVLVAVMVLMVLRHNSLGPLARDRHHSSPVMDLLLAMATLVYLVGHHRFLSIRRNAVPPDARREKRPGHDRLAGRWFLPRKAAKRSGGLVAAGEVLGFLIGVPVFALVAYLLWLRLEFEQSPDLMDLPVPVYRVVLVVWVGLMGLCGAYALLAYIRGFHAGRVESLLYMQDQLWDATRGEQRAAGRWLAWARERRERKEERR